MHVKLSQKILVGGVLIHEGKLLLVKRDDRFILPQGVVDFGEHPQESVTKYFLEVTGLLVEAFVPFYTSSKIDTNEVHLVEILYLVDLVDGEDLIVTLSDEYEKYEWVDGKEIKNYISEDDEDAIISINIAFELYEDWNKQLN